MADTPGEDANETDTDADGHDADEHESDPIVVVNYRSVIEEQTWKDFKDQIPRSERLDDYINDLIRKDTYGDTDPPHRTANRATPNTITTAERDQRERQQ